MSGQRRVHPRDMALGLNRPALVTRGTVLVVARTHTLRQETGETHRVQRPLHFFSSHDDLPRRCYQALLREPLLGARVGKRVRL